MELQSDGKKVAHVGLEDKSNPPPKVLNEKNMSNIILTKAHIKIC